MFDQTDLANNYPRVMLQTSGWPASAALADTGYGTQHPPAGTALGIGSYRMIDREFHVGGAGYGGGPSSPAQLASYLAKYPAGSLHLIGAETIYDAAGVGTSAAYTTLNVFGAVGSVGLGSNVPATITAHRAFTLDQVERFRVARPDMPAVIEIVSFAPLNLFTVSAAQFATWRPLIIASMADFIASDLGQAVDGICTRLQWTADERNEYEANWGIHRRQLRELGEMWREAGWTKHLGLQIWPVNRTRIRADGFAIQNHGGLIPRRLNRERKRMGIFPPWDRLYIWDYYIASSYAPGWPPPWWRDLVRIAQEAAIVDAGGSWPGDGSGGVAS